MRERWEIAAKEASFTNSLAGIVGRLDALPGQIREISKSVYLEMRMQEVQQQTANKDRLFNRTNTVMAVAMVVIAFVTLYKSVL